MDELLNALIEATHYDFALYAWNHAPDSDYGVVSLDSGEDLVCDNKHVEKGLSGYVDYFTRDATSTPKDAIESVLNGFCAFRLNSVQFEDDTEYIHYEWVVKLYA